MVLLQMRLGFMIGRLLYIGFLFWMEYTRNLTPSPSPFTERGEYSTLGSPIAIKFILQAGDAGSMADKFFLNCLFSRMYESGQTALAIAFIF
jgi:hypothetical protein